MKHCLNYFILFVLCIVLVSCQKEEKKAPELVTAENICQCSDDLYKFGLEAQKTLHEAKKEERARILREAESKMDEFEKCLVKAQIKAGIKEGSIDPILIEKTLKEHCQNKPGSYLSRLLSDVKAKI